MGKFIDLTNKEFGEWHVNKYLGKQMWECKCSCGKIKSINGADLRKGKSTSCGHTRKNDHTGETIGDYKVIKYNGDYRWECECIKCGKKSVIHTYFLEHNQLPVCLHGGLDTRIVDIKDMTFGEWHVDSYSDHGYWNCTCSCGKQDRVLGKDLRSGRSKSCGHMHKKLNEDLDSEDNFIDLTNKQIGELHVDKNLGDHKWECTCSCNNKVVVSTYRLRYNIQTTCGHNKERILNIINKQFGELTTKKYLGNGFWECECSCGEKVTVRDYDITSGERQYCDKRKHTIIDITGRQFGELKVIRDLGNGKWECQCSCGKIVSVLKNNLLKPLGTRSCGCKTYEIRYKHMRSKYHRDDIQISAGSNEEEARKYIYEIFGDNKITLEELADLLGIQYSSTFYAVKRLNIRDLIKVSYDSKQERELTEFIKTIYSGKIEVHNRKILNSGKELDIYIPEKRIAIEFNGNYWHSDYNKDKIYHQEKTIECIKQKIRLVHIFEYEYKNIQDKLKIHDFLKDLLCDKQIIFAKNTQICELDTEEEREFLEKYHLQGYTSSSIAIGLKYKDLLVGIMTFGSPRFNKDYQYEMLRMCFRTGTGIVGGSDKMLKYFIDKFNPTSILSYCNLSKFDGNGYIKMGFTTNLDMLTEPNYIWVNINDNTVLTRYKTQKKKLVDAGLENYGNTEDEIMKNLGYFKIYDSGNMKFIWKSKEVNT